MRNVYLSFLGLGIRDQETGRHDYRPAVYELDGRRATETRFVQAAEMELLGGALFHQVLIVATQKSRDAHFDSLREEMRKHGAEPALLVLEEDFSAQGQWKWFESILKHVEPRDRLSVDLTHGYRAIPIIFSTAINFLQKSRGITLAAVYYGAYDNNRQLSPLVDMKDFYIVNEWAEAVSRLVEDADARKMAQVAEQSSGSQVGELNDEELITALEDLTNAVRNVEVNTVAARANKALELVGLRREAASTTGKLLLGLVVDKFTTLSTQGPVSGRYDADYFRVQLAIASLLLEHRLYMQAFTVLREFIGSLAMIPRQGLRMTNAEGRKRRVRYGDVFIQMIHWPREEWGFSAENQERVDKLLAFYDELERIGVVEQIRCLMKDLSDFRNGFDHAWTSKVADFSVIVAKGDQINKELEMIFERIRESGLIGE